MSKTILVSGGAGYIGSHAVYALRLAGYRPVVVDNLSTGREFAVGNHAFEQGDIGDAAFVAAVCAKHQPIAALHFAAFIEVGESVRDPSKYFTNNRDKAGVFFKTLQNCGVHRVVFSSTAAVYGETGGSAPIEETTATKPINPYGQSKLDAETYLRTLDGMSSVTLRYFNVAGAASSAGIGEAHWPETHLIPRLLLPLLDTPAAILDKLGLKGGFTIYGEDYPTPDGTAIRDYVHVLDLIDAHLRALDYLLGGGATNIFNLGSGVGFSVKDIVNAVRIVTYRPDFTPGKAPRREGDPAFLVASSKKAEMVLGWKPKRTLAQIIEDAAAWHRSDVYRQAMQG